MINNPIRLIVLDLDGTLLCPEQVVLPSDEEAIKAAMQAGVKIALCSGRTSDNMSFIAQRLGLKDASILSLNGAYCLSGPFGKAYREHYFAPEALSAILEVLSDDDLTYGGFQRNKVYSIAKGGDYDAADRHWGVIPHPGWQYIAHGIERYRASDDKRLNKLVIVDEDPDLLKQLRKKLTPIEQIDVSSSWINNLELMPKGIDKGLAVKELSESLGLQASQVMAIGDFDTDTSMIAYAGLGVAMGNAPDTLKAIANVTTDTNILGGVGNAIRKHVLGQKPIILGGTHESQA